MRKDTPRTSRMLFLALSKKDGKEEEGGNTVALTMEELNPPDAGVISQILFYQVVLKSLFTQFFLL